MPRRVGSARAESVRLSGSAHVFNRLVDNVMVEYDQRRSLSTDWLNKNKRSKISGLAKFENFAAIVSTPRSRFVVSSEGGNAAARQMEKPDALHDHRQERPGIRSRSARRPRCSRPWAGTTSRSSMPASCWRPKGCRSSKDGATSPSTRARSTVKDGPFTEAKELVAGFWIIQVKSTRRGRSTGPSASRSRTATVEVRRVSELDRFRGRHVPEAIAAEEAMRAEIAKQDQLKEPGHPCAIS